MSAFLFLGGATEGDYSRELYGEKYEFGVARV